MAHSGAGDNPQTIQPSSNDWDYTNSQDEWPFAGNALGDHSTGYGGYVDNTGGDSCFRSLITFDGDFEITFTGANFTNLIFCLYEILEDAADSSPGEGNATIRTGMTNYWAWLAGGSWTGHSTGSFVYNNTGEGTPVTPSASDTIKLERVSGQINYYSNDTLRRAFTTTSSNPVRFWIGAAGGTQPDIDDMQFVDYAKVQRDGFFNEGKTGNIEFGDAQANKKHIGRRIKATRSGYLTEVSIYVSTHTADLSCKAKLYSDDGTNPSSLIGTASDVTNITGTGKQTMTFSTTDAVVEKGTVYWVVCSDEGTTGNVIVDQTTGSGLGDHALGSGNKDIITGIADTETHEFQMEMVVNTSAGEPTPDHDTRFLVHSDTIDASTTFTDSSQIGATVTANGNVQHDTAQTLGFGTSSILFDGSGDYLSVPSNTLYTIGTGSFTADAIVRFNSSVTNKMIMGNRNSSSSSKWVMGTNGSGKLVVSSSVATFITGGTTLLTGVNYHLAAVRAGNQLSIYVNGTSDASTVTNTNDFSDDSVILIGGNDNDGLTDFDGWMKEPRFSTVARWDANFTPPTSAYP